MKLVLFGDGQWAADSLRELLADGHEVLAVVLRHKPTDQSLVTLAHAEGIETRAPEKVNDIEFVSWIRSLQLDLSVSFAYDQIVKKPLIESNLHGFINCHAGMLPLYRGRNIINWAIINNEREIGLTVHFIDEGLDTGDIILQRSLPIDWNDTYGSVLNNVSNAFPSLLVEAVRLIEKGKVERQPQPKDGTYFSGRGPGDEWIDWEWNSLRIYNLIRGITRPGPGARTLLSGRTLIIWKASYDPAWLPYISTPGEVAGVIPGIGIKVKTGDAVLLIERVQFVDEPDEQIARLPIGTRLGVNRLDLLSRLQRELS